MMDSSYVENSIKPIAKQKISNLNTLNIRVYKNKKVRFTTDITKSIKANTVSEDLEATNYQIPNLYLISPRLQCV